MKPDGEYDRELEQLAARLGARGAERLNVERTAAAVVARLRTERAARQHWWIRPVWWRAAAALVLIVGGGVLVRDRFMNRAQMEASHYVREDLQDLSTDQLRQVLGSLDATLNDAASEPAEAELNDLTTEQLQALLQSLEG